MVTPNPIFNIFISYFVPILIHSMKHYMYKTVLLV